jgi:hypothetical protein
MISTGLQEFYCSATIDYMQSSSSLTVVTVDSLQSAVVLM